MNGTHIRIDMYLTEQNPEELHIHGQPIPEKQPGISKTVFKKKHSYVYVLEGCLCATVHTCHSACVGVRRHLAGLSSPLLPYGSQGSD